MKPKLAVVRGNYFSQDEVPFYEPLQDEFEITFLSSVKGTAKVEGNPKVMEVKCLGGLLNPLTGGMFRKISGLWNNITGVEPEYLFGLKRTLQGFDLVHTIDYDFFMTYQLAKLRSKLGFKLVAIHWENIPFARDSKPLCRFVKYKVYENIDAFFAMSERAKASLILEGVGPSKIFVVGYGVDTDKFKPDTVAGRAWRNRFAIGDDEIVILFVGRVRASKGVFELIYATKKMIDDPELSTKKIRVVIAGRGPGEKEVADTIKKLDLRGNILQIGFIPHNEIHGLHNMADIFCLPSVPRKYWQEQLGIVFLEAMACGKPVVSTLSGSIPEVVGHAGILVQPNDHVGLCEGLSKLITDQNLRLSLGNQGRDRALKIFANNKISENMRIAYRSLLNTNAR